MLHDLIELATKLQKDKKLPPASYKPKSVTWVIDLSGDKPYLKGPFKKGEFREVFSPDCTRSSNILPYLLLDKASYVLGIQDNKDKADESIRRQKSFIRLLQKAYEKTGMEELVKILDFYKKPLSDDIRQNLMKISPEETVTFQVDAQILPFERQEIQQFWQEHLAEDLLSDDEANCAICSLKKPYVRITTRGINLFGESPKLTSFNKSAYASFYKKQTKNVPICITCSTLTVDTLNYLLKNPLNHTLIFKKETAGKKLDPLGSQMAVYWVKDIKESWDYKEKPDEIKEQLVSLLSSPIKDLLKVKGESRRVPPPEFKQLQELLRAPWTGFEEALRIDSALFYMAVLSANKTRLVIREWIHTSVLSILKNLKQYFDAIRIVNPWEKERDVQPLPLLLQAIENKDANLVKGLLRTIYMGYKPHPHLLISALQRFRLSNVLTDPKEYWRCHSLASVLKLALTYGKEEAKTMESLNPGYLKPSYLCGRLLAVLEEIQQRASGFKVGSTIVQRFYGAASTAPASTFGPLLRLTTTAHLPKVSPEMAQLLEDVIKQLDEAGGFPSTLSLKQQAEFGLGFYHQRAEFTSRRKNKLNKEWRNFQ